MMTLQRFFPVALVLGAVLFAAPPSRAEIPRDATCSIECGGNTCWARGTGSKCTCDDNNSPSCTGGTLGELNVRRNIEDRIAHAATAMTHTLMSNLGSQPPIPPLCGGIHAASIALSQNDLPGYLAAIGAIEDALGQLDQGTLDAVGNLILAIPASPGP